MQNMQMMCIKKRAYESMHSSLWAGSGQPHKNIHLEKYFPKWIFLNVFHNFLKNQFLHIF